jgi:O-antigen/teichoic acid export membrane protein
VFLVTVVAIGDIFFLNVANMMSQVFQTYELVRISAFMGLFSNASRFLVASFLLLFYHQVTAKTWAHATVTVSFLCAAISLTIAIMRFGPPVFPSRARQQTRRRGDSFAMSGTAVGAYNDGDKVMLVHYGMSAANGIYAMAYRVVDICTALIRSIHSAAFPRFFRLGTQDVEPTVQFAFRLLRRTSP